MLSVQLHCDRHSVFLMAFWDALLSLHYVWRWNDYAWDLRCSFLYQRSWVRGKSIWTLHYSCGCMISQSSWNHLIINSSDFLFEILKLISDLGLPSLQVLDHELEGIWNLLPWIILFFYLYFWRLRVVRLIYAELVVVLGRLWHKSPSFVNISITHRLCLDFLHHAVKILFHLTVEGGLREIF